MGLGGLGSISNLGNQGLSGVSKLPIDILSGLGPNGIGSLTNQVLSLGGNAGGIATDQAAGLGNLVSILSLGNLGSSGVGKLPVIGGLANEVLSPGGKAASDQAGFGGLGSILNLGNLGLSGVLQTPASILSGLGPSGITSLISQGLGGNAGSSGSQAGITSNQAGFGGLGSILSLGNLGLSGVLQIPASILSGLGPSGITSLISQGLGGNAVGSGNQAGITSDQTDQLGAAVNIVKGADVQPQVHGSLGSGSSISSSSTLGLHGLGLGGIGLIPQQITSSSSDVISGTASGAPGLASGVSGLAKSVSGLASGASELASGVASTSGRVVSLPTQVLNIGGNTGLSGTLPSTTSDQLGITLNTGAGGLGTGSKISSTANLGLGSVPTQIIEQTAGRKGLLNGLIPG
ncbi:spidroin-1-like [Hyperolius riggenbachi]|uniref:spidroin-1-like n=1 Tax=Hyperolius riggenbachi TaxID=752182 RepID=UPI0035A3AC69